MCAPRCGRAFSIFARRFVTFRATCIEIFRFTEQIIVYRFVARTQVTNWQLNAYFFCVSRNVSFFFFLVKRQLVSASCDNSGRSLWEWNKNEKTIFPWSKILVCPDCGQWLRRAWNEALGDDCTIYGNSVVTILNQNYESARVRWTFNRMWIELNQTTNLRRMHRTKRLQWIGHKPYARSAPLLTRRLRN